MQLTHYMHQLKTVNCYIYTKTFRLINECDLQLYEGVSFNSQSQTEEQSFENTK